MHGLRSVGSVLLPPTQTSCRGVGKGVTKSRHTVVCAYRMNDTFQDLGRPSWNLNRGGTYLSRVAPTRSHRSTPFVGPLLFSSPLPLLSLRRRGGALNIGSILLELYKREEAWWTPVWKPGRACTSTVGGGELKEIETGGGGGWFRTSVREGGKAVLGKAVYMYMYMCIYIYFSSLAESWLVG